MSTLLTLPHDQTLATPAADTAKKPTRKPTPVDLLKMAAAAKQFATKKAAGDALRNAGFVSSARVVELLLAAAHSIERKHLHRSSMRIRERLGHDPLAGTAAATRPPVLLPKGTPATRVNAAKVLAVKTVACSLLRFGAAGGTTMRVSFASNGSQVRYAVTMGKNRTTYSGAYDGWTASEDHHSICVPKDWRVRVERAGLANLGGLMTLDAHALIPHDDVVVYAATWARQGRGYGVQVDRGFIALLKDEHFHADSAQGAVKGVRRKVSAADGSQACRIPAYELTVDAFVARYKGRKLNVSVSDAEESGSCDYGIRSWCEFVGIDYAGREAPMAQILEGFKARPQVEVRRAVLFAMRRHRAERRANKV